MDSIGGPERPVLEYSLCFNFQASNNQTNYEALIAGMMLAKEVGVTHFLTQTDSLLISSQVRGEFQTKDPSLVRYLRKALKMSQTFVEFEVNDIPMEEHVRADLLARLASTKASSLNKMAIP